MDVYKTHDGMMNNIESLIEFEGWQWRDFSESKQYDEMSSAIYNFLHCLENKTLTNEYEDD